jgi:hypothetical protein
VLASVMSEVPAGTLTWLLGEDNPAVSVLTRRWLLGKADDEAAKALWARRNDYAPIAQILDDQLADGSWAPPARDYQKYWGSLWQIHFLGELWADGTGERVQHAAAYAFSRQLPDGSWSTSNKRPSGSIPCLTANVGRALARLGYAHDERTVAALRYCVDLVRDAGVVNCRQAQGFQLNGYCHMLTPKLLLFLAEIPRDLWPDGAEELCGDCVERLREKSVLRCLPAEASQFNLQLRAMSSAERQGFRERFLAENPTLHYEDKPGWLRFGYPLSYNSDALEALDALVGIGEPRREEYLPALHIVAAAADSEMRWSMRNSFNGKMLADIEARGKPSKWLTLRALRVLEHFSV